VHDNPTPLTIEEYSQLICLLDGFLSDKDPNAVLAIEPDMRMIQACFKILKATINEGDIIKDPNKNNLVVCTASEYSECPELTKAETYEELSQKIQDRDNEISNAI